MKKLSGLSVYHLNTYDMWWFNKTFSKTESEEYIKNVSQSWY